MNYVSYEWTLPRSCSQVRPYQVWPQSEKNCTRESVNGLSRSKQLISSLSTHVTSYVSHEQTRPRSCSQERPYQVWPQSEKNCIRENVNGQSRSKQSISSLSAYLTSYTSPMNELVRDLAPKYILTKFDCNWRRTAPGRALTGLCLQMDRRTDRLTISFQYTPLSTSLSGGIIKAL